MFKRALVTSSAICSLFVFTPVMASSGGQINPYATPEVQLLKQIETTLSDIGHTLNQIAISMFAAPTDLGNYLANIQALNKLEQEQAKNTQKSTDYLANLFQSQDSLVDTVNNTYSIPIDNYGPYDSLSAYSLLGLNEYRGQFTPTYNSDQEKAAKTYKTFLSGAALAMPQGGDAKTTQDKQRANLARTLAAVQSLDAYNVSKVYESHYPSLDASTAGVNLPTPDGRISSAELINYQMQNNVNNPDWYSNMATASSTAVQRQILFVLAAGVSSLYRIEQNQEQILLTQTAGNTATIAMAQAIMQMTDKANQQVPQLGG